MFTCKNCGYKTLKWMGRCPQCSMWETFEQQSPAKKKRSSLPEAKVLNINSLTSIKEERIPTNINEFDRVLGGGLVKGEVILLGGEPGVGKSTLLLQTADKLAKNKKVLYVSAEESANQISLRAKRLGIDNKNLFIVAEDKIESILPLFQKDYSLIIIDSIQVVYLKSLGSSKGSLLQVRESTNILTEKAKKSGVGLMIIGHVTKEGNIAGPKVLEHVVDCVVYFEGEKNSSFKILRAMKNRFGSVGEIGIFEMTNKGLNGVENPSSLFLSEDETPQSGRSVSCIIEGIRPVLVEIQALVTRGSFGVARRRFSGIDFNRASLLLAMMEKRLGFHLSDQDVFVNVTGGMKIDDTTADLALAVAIASSFENFIIPRGFIFISELGLSGELRKAQNYLKQIKEAQRLGFTLSFISKKDAERINPGDVKNISVHGFSHLKEVLSRLKEDSPVPE